MEKQMCASAVGNEPRQKWKIIHRFGKHCSCHHQSKYGDFGSKFLTFDLPNPRKPKFYVELMPRQHKDKNDE